MNPSYSNQASYSWFQSHTSRQVGESAGWFMETQKPLETESSSERGGRREPAESAGKEQRKSDLRLLTLFHVAGSHSYFWFIILHRPEDFRKSAFFFFSQFLANAQAELCLLKRKIIYWDSGIDWVCMGNQIYQAGLASSSGGACCKGPCSVIFPWIRTEHKTQTFAQFL